MYFKGNIWGADPADLKSTTKLIKAFNFCYSLLIFLVNMQRLFLKDIKSLLGRNQGNEFYNISTKPWLQDSDIEFFSTQDEGKSFVAERLIRNSKQ